MILSYMNTIYLILDNTTWSEDVALYLGWELGI